MLIKQGACAIKTGKWGLMATPPAASAISLPFRTRRRRYITTLIWAALHHSFRKHFYNFSPLAPTPLSHCAPFPPPPTKVHNGSVLRRTVGPVTEEGVVSRWGGGAASSRRVYQGDDAALSVLLNVAPPLPTRFDESRAGRARSLMEGAEEAKTSWRFSTMALWFISWWLAPLWRTKWWQWRNRRVAKITVTAVFQGDSVLLWFLVSSPKGQAVFKNNGWHFSFYNIDSKLGSWICNDGNHQPLAFE